LKTDFGTFLKNQPAEGKFPRLIFFHSPLYFASKHEAAKEKGKR